MCGEMSFVGSGVVGTEQPAPPPHILVFGVVLEEETEAGWMDGERV